MYQAGQKDQREATVNTHKRSFSTAILYMSSLSGQNNATYISSEALTNMCSESEHMLVGQSTHLRKITTLLLLV